MLLLGQRRQLCLEVIGLPLGLGQLLLEGGHLSLEGRLIFALLLLQTLQLLRGVLGLLRGVLLADHVGLGLSQQQGNVTAHAGQAILFGHLLGLLGRQAVNGVVLHP